MKGMRVKKKSQRISTPTAEAQVGPLTRGWPSWPCFRPLTQNGVRTPSLESWPNQVLASERLREIFRLPHSNLRPPPCLS